MNIAILHILKDDGAVSTPDFAAETARLLDLKGHDVKSVCTVYESAAKESAEAQQKNVDAILVTGETDAFRANLAAEYNVSQDAAVFEKEGIIYLITQDAPRAFIFDTVLPALNSRTKTLYTSAVFRTFGLNAAQINEILSDVSRNKNRIAFRVTELSGLICEIRLRYSNKTNDTEVKALAARVAENLKDYLYAQADTQLADTVFNLLQQRGLTVCFAESFTGGGAAHALIAKAGASAFVKEGVIAYANESKIKRLHVDPQTLNRFGAASIETVYEMAAGSLAQTNCDIAVATTGSADADTENVFYIAIGTKSGVHIYRHTHTGTREEVMQAGVNAALFYLYTVITNPPTA
ncbi:MAG: nicotinamide-nucleotide amidohydrolase family protein [Firmicutes bacterium]|nr:nicotinamide-nucleotide amidohydrolase family protein [Bacillota bacterium]